MKTRLSVSAAAIALALLVLPARGQTPTPTPTPTPGPRLAPAPAASPAPRKSGSLADTVRRVRASATPVPKKKSLGVITNESLHKPEGSGKGSVQVGPARPIGDLPSGSGSASEPDGSERQWRSRANEARERVSTAQDEVKRLELENKRLENDFYAWSDGNYRDRVIKPAWDQARDELKKAHADLDAAQNAQADLEEEARKVGVPAGWLRER